MGQWYYFLLGRFVDMTISSEKTQGGFNDVRSSLSNR